MSYNAQSNPRQMHRTGKQNTQEIFPIGHTAQVYPQPSLFHGDLEVSSCCVVNISQEILPDITFIASFTASFYITCYWQTPSMRTVF